MLIIIGLVFIAIILWEIRGYLRARKSIRQVLRKLQKDNPLKHGYGYKAINNVLWTTYLFSANRWCNSWESVTTLRIPK